jgi:retron-type reverse transcriptase
MKRLSHVYQNIISVENLLLAWSEFLRDKRNRKDVQAFSIWLMPNIQKLHNELKMENYQHGGYFAFAITDPKPRDIHKASVRDRLLHHAIYQKLYSHFDKRFIFDSYSCRFGKGTHRAVEKFKTFIDKVGKNNTKTIWVLKCDVRKFFASIDHEILFSILQRHIEDDQLIGLLKNIVHSFNGQHGKGLPLGNLTSQLLVNIYMNEFDQYVKHTLKQRYYIRYADDFVFLSADKKELEGLLPLAVSFLEENLKLSFHPNKVFIKTIASGVDFLGWVQFPNHRVLRTSTKKRMLKNLKQTQKEEVKASYRGMLSHGNSYKLEMIIDKVVR